MGAGTVNLNVPIFVSTRPWGSTCTMVTYMYFDQAKDVPREVAGHLFFFVLLKFFLVLFSYLSLFLSFSLSLSLFLFLLSLFLFLLSSFFFSFSFSFYLVQSFLRQKMVLDPTS
eukprot:Lithocolla_globosa_v1_NODE_3029_length_1787_cov_30.149538.p1 type:complete len:114 gc:universal NODE_3029_length_1787_cov_30.149538:1170-1511(+)